MKKITIVRANIWYRKNEWQPLSIVDFARFIKKNCTIYMIPVLLAIIEKKTISFREDTKRETFITRLRLAEKEENEGKKCTSPINSLRRTRGPAGRHHFHRMKVKLDSAGAVEWALRCHRGHAFADVTNRPRRFHFVCRLVYARHIREL